MFSNKHDTNRNNGGERCASAASIPSRLEPRRRKKVFSDGCFGSAKKFDDSHINDRPGTGKYHPDILTNPLSKNPGVSKRGHGAFISSKKKLVDCYLPASITPGPGAYNLDLKPAGFAIQFTTCKDGRVPYYVQGKGNPGPLDYKVNDDFTPKLMKRQESYFMRSKSDKNLGSFLSLMSAAPGVGVYTLPNSFNDPNKPAFIWSKSTFIRFTDIGVDNKVPPSTKYFDNREEALTAHTQGRVLRSAGGYRGKYVGKQYTAKAEAAHTFGADADRFKHSFCGRLDLAAEAPGVLQYEVRWQDRPRTTPVNYRSKSPNRPDIAKKGIPSPLYYHPTNFLYEKTPMSANPDNRWI